MSAKITDALAAYAAAARGPGTTAAAPADSGFAAMVTDAATEAIEAGHRSEQVSQQAIAGKADVRDVVTAVANAELTLETVVAVRDKVVAAYNDILRMPI